MKITKLNKSDFVAELSQSELSAYSLSFEALDIEAPPTQKLMLDLLARAGTVPDKNLSKMCVDAFRLGSYICIFIAFRPKSRFKVIEKPQNLLVRAFDENSFLDLVSFLLRCCDIEFGTYKIGKEYFVKTAKRTIDGIHLKHLLSEFGEVIDDPDCDFSLLCEHAEFIRKFKPKP